MQETIKKIMEAEKRAAEIVTEAKEKAVNLIAGVDSELSDKLNKFREEELKRFNSEIEKASVENSAALEKIKKTEVSVTIDLDAVSNEVLARILNTVFD